MACDPAAEVPKMGSRAAVEKARAIPRWDARGARQWLHWGPRRSRTLIHIRRAGQRTPGRCCNLERENRARKFPAPFLFFHGFGQSGGAFHRASVEKAVDASTNASPARGHSGGLPEEARACADRPDFWR